MASVYDPLSYENITRSCVHELLGREACAMPPPDFLGAGIYALFYVGGDPRYASVCSASSSVGSTPIYVGKAIPAGGRKGDVADETNCRALFLRLSEHAASIGATALPAADFRCRYLVVKQVWIPLVERFLISHYQPVWNVCLEGFGNHDPGAGRREGENTWWDALHPGRPWAARLRQTKTQAEAEERLRVFLGNRSLHPAREP